MDRGLRALGFSAPAILGEDLETGLLLIEDLGNEPVVDARRSDPRALRARRRACSRGCTARRCRTCCRSPTAATTRCRPTISMRMLIEVELLLDWYVPHVAGQTFSGSVRGEFVNLWREALAEIVGGAGDLDPARLPFAEPDLAAGARGPQARRAARFPGRGARPPGLRRRLAAAGRPRHRAGGARAQAARRLCPRARRPPIPAFDMRGFRARLRHHGRAARHQDRSASSRASTSATASRTISTICRASRPISRRNLAHPALARLRAWYETHLPRLVASPSSRHAHVRFGDHVARVRASRTDRWARIA